MATSCDLVAQDMGTGVAAALTAVDCIASQVSEQAFGRLNEGPLGAALPILLTFFVAFIGISLMMGRSNLSVRALLPKILTLGLVLTFATSFVAVSSVFYNLFLRGPDEIASIITGSDGSATATFAMKLDVVFLAIQEASDGQTDIDIFTPPGMMWMGATMLLLGTVGLLVTARIGLALLLAVGPIFVVLALFNGTRGLFTGWLKGMVMLAMVPIFAVVGGSIMLEMAVPILAELVTVPGDIDQQAAMGFFVVGFVHCALMLMSLVVASKMVSGWQVFGLVPSAQEKASYDTTRMAPRQTTVLAPDRAARAAPAVTAATGQRRIDVSAPQTGIAANDAGQTGTNTVRETKVYATSGGTGQVSPTSSGPSRTRGIGNRFRTHSHAGAKGGAAPKTETPQ
ncbi:MAG: type IV secretion system protein [Pseudomonadota bacterium]